MEALLGARQSIERFKPQLLIEKIKSNEAELQKFVTALGYKVFQLGINLLAIHTSDPVCSDVVVTKSVDEPHWIGEINSKSDLETAHRDK